MKCRQRVCLLLWIMLAERELNYSLVPIPFVLGHPSVFSLRGRQWGGEDREPNNTKLGTKRGATSLAWEQWDYDPVTHNAFRVKAEGRDNWQTHVPKHTYISARMQANSTEMGMAKSNKRGHAEVSWWVSEGVPGRGRFLGSRTISRLSLTYIHHVRGIMGLLQLRLLDRSRVCFCALQSPLCCWVQIDERKTWDRKFTRSQELINLRLTFLQGKLR